MVSSDYVFKHVELVIAAIRGDTTAIDRMDISAEGFWRSFAAIVYSLPALIFIWAIIVRRDTVTETASPASRFGFEAFYDVATWLGLAALMVLVLRALDLQARTAHVIIARNWTTLVFNYVYAFCLVPGLLFGMQNPAFGIMMLVVFITMIIIQMRITMIALEGRGFTAAALVSAEIFLVMLISTLVYPSS